MTASVRVVHEPVDAFACLRPIDGDPENLCTRPRAHRGGCLPLPARWCQREINAENPRYRSVT